ncbi:MAG: type II toxin-antitoxin system HipA family toxin [Deltaproteobacteria bacterium]|nr:type II toxin-antitoxin system HipA family toxin [Deltaproteobacteria bacterium]
MSEQPPPLHLRVFFEQQLVGDLTARREEGEARFRFTYRGEWLRSASPFALSVPLSLREEPYGHQETRAYLENLLPEGEVLTQLRRYARQRGEPGGLSDEGYFLRRFGVDCAGALVITEDERPPRADEPPALRPLDLEVIYAHLTARRPLTAEMIYEHGGRFSLAGAQDKFPLIYRGGALWIPTNGAPTTHILKPMSRGARGDWNTPLNELFCMRLAAEVGLRVPRVSVIEGPQPLYLVERFDRVSEGERVRRVHQQDLCQAHGLTSALKYESDGGPRFAEHARLIQERSTAPIADLEQLIRWLWFNILIGNNDCHAKNLSLLSTPAGLRLAPFYDLLSTALYKDLSPSFSYSLGGCWLWHDLKPKHIELLAAELRIPSARLNKLGAQMAALLAQRAERLALPELRAAESHDVINALRALIQRRAEHLKGRLRWA